MKFTNELQELLNKEGVRVAVYVRERSDVRMEYIRSYVGALSGLDVKFYIEEDQGCKDAFEQEGQECKSEPGQECKGAVTQKSQACKSAKNEDCRDENQGECNDSLGQECKDEFAQECNVASGQGCKRELEKLIRLKDNYDIIMTRNLSRLSRNAKEALEIIKALEPTPVYFNAEGLFTKEPDAKLKFEILQELASEEKKHYAGRK